MSLNFMGLGFSFGGKDSGLRKLQTTIATQALEIDRAFSSIASTTLDAAKSLSSLVDTVGPVYGTAEAVDSLGDSIVKIADKIDQMPNKAADAVSAAADRIESIAQKAKTTPSFIEKALSSATKTLLRWTGEIQTSDTAVDRSAQKVRGTFAKLAAYIGEPFEKANVAVRSVIDGVSKRLNPIRKAIGGVGSAVKMLGDSVKSKIEGIRSAFTMVGSSVDSMKDAVLTRAAAIRESFDELKASATLVVDALAERFPRVAGAMKTTWGYSKRFVETVGKGLNKLKLAAGNMKGRFSSLFDTFKRGGSNVLGFFSKMASRLAFWRKLDDEVEETETLFKRFKDTLGQVATALRLDELHSFLDSLSLDNLESAIRGVQNLAEEGQNLTTGLEAEMQRNAQTARRMGANFGLAGRDLARFSSQAAGMAQSMNIDAGTAAEATFQWTQAQRELSAVGIRSARDLAALQEVTGATSETLSNSFRRMRQEFNFSDEAMQLMSASTVETGQALGNVGDQLNAMPRLLDQMRQRAALAGRTMSDMDLARMAVSTNQLAMAFRRTGSSSEEARDSAVELSGTLIGAQRNLQNMFGGTESDLGSFTESMGVSLGDIGETFNLMQQGPSGMVAGLAQMVQAARRDGRNTAQAMQFLGSHLEQAVGEDQASRLMTFFQTADQGTLDMMARGPQATRSLRDVARAGFSTGRTLAESFDLAKESFIASFRSIGRRHAAEFVRDTTREFGRFNRMLRGVVERGGPLAGLVEKMSEVHQIGTLALIPQTLRPMAAAFGTLASSALPFVQAMGSMGLRITSIFGPAGILIAVLVALGMRIADLMMQGKTFGQAIEQVGSDIAGLADRVGPVVSRFLDSVASSIVTLSDRMWTWAQRVDWADLFTRIGRAMLDALRGAGQFLSEIAHGVMNLFMSGFEPRAASSRIGRVMSNLVQTIMRIFQGLGTAISRSRGGLIDGLVSSIRTGIPRVRTMLVDAARVLLNGLIRGLAEGLPLLGRALTWLSSAVRRWLPVLTSMVLDGLEYLLVAVWNVLGTLWRNLPQLLGGLADVFNGALNLISSLIDGALSGIENWLARRFPAAAGVVHAVFGFLRRTFDNTFTILRTLVRFVADALSWLVARINLAIAEFPYMWRVLSEAASEAWTAIRDVVMTVVNAVAAMWGSFRDSFVSLYQALASVASSVWNTIAGTVRATVADITRIWQGLWDFLGGMFGGITAVINGDLDAAAEKFTHVKDIAVGAFNSIMSTVQSLFGHSVNTVVGRDMDKTVDVVREATGQVQNEIEQSLFVAVSRALVNAFRSAFASIHQFSTRFLTSETDLFARMARTVVQTFSNMWRNVLDQTSVSVDAVSSEVSRITASISQLTVAMQAARNVASAAPISPQQQPVRAAGSSPMQTLIEATDNPRWWEQEYKPMVQQMLATMGAMVAALQNQAAAPANRRAGATDRASRRVEQLGREDVGVTGMLGVSPSGSPTNGG